MSETANLYDNVYGDFGSRAEAAVRHDAFGEDIGQSSWMTAAAWLRFADQAQVRQHSHVLEVGSGSGGPAVYLAAARNCRVTVSTSTSTASATEPGWPRHEASPIG